MLPSLLIPQTLNSVPHLPSSPQLPTPKPTASSCSLSESRLVPQMATRWEHRPAVRLGLGHLEDGLGEVWGSVGPPRG